MGKDSSQNSLCPFKCNTSFSELITLPIKAVLPSGRVFYPKVYLCTCRQVESRMFDLDMSGVICFGSYAIQALIFHRVAGERWVFVTRCVQFLNAVC